MENENIQELKFQVGEAWKGVYSSSTAYGLANVVQDPTGLSVYRSLKSGNVGHPLNNRTWWFCIIDMSSIKAESDRITALNQAIAQDEALRVAAEELRQQHETERIAAETQRNEAEQARVNAEQERVGAESARATAEQQRITAEQERVSAESARVQAEQARVLSETLRANAEDQRAANEQNRIAAEQQRIERAESDHQRVESDLADIAVYTDSLGAFDLSKHNAVDGVLATYADLSAALTALNALDSKYKYGGMSFKFVLSSDNKYVQYRLMSDSFNTTPANWQGVDAVPTAGSHNIVESRGVAEAIGTLVFPVTFSNGSYKEFANLNIKSGQHFIVKIETEHTLSRCIISINGTSTRIIDKYNIASTYIQELTANVDISSLYVYATSENEDKRITISVVENVGYNLYDLGVRTDKNTSDISNIGYYRAYNVDVYDVAKVLLDKLNISSGEKIIVKVSSVAGVTRLVVSPNSNLQPRIIDYDSATEAHEIFQEYTAIDDISELYVYLGTSTTKDITLELFSKGAYDVEHSINEIEDAEDAINEIEDDINEIEDDINEIEDAIFIQNSVWNKIVDPQITEGGFISKSDGNAYDYANYNYTEAYINIDGYNRVKIMNAGNTSSDAGYAFYKKEGNTYTYISGDNQIHSIELTVPAEATHIRFSTGKTYLNPSLYGDTYVKSLTVSKLRGKNIVCFGDSITEFKDEENKSYADYIAEKSGANVINVGIGGSYYRQRTTPVLTPTTSTEAKAALDVISMVQASMDGDFTYQVAAAEYLRDHESDDNTAIITRLSNIDWSTVDIVTFFAGTNDWNNSVRFGESGDTDITTTIGAINTIISEILTNYPKIKIYFFTPIVRCLNYAGTVVDENWSDNVERGGYTLRTFSRFLENEVILNHIPVYNAYDKLGWNKYNFSEYFVDSDGTHPYKGFSYIGSKFQAFLESNI